MFLNWLRRTWPLGKDMTILKYVQRLDELPSHTRTCPFAEDLNTRAIRESNRQVQTMSRGGQLQKWEIYIKYDDATHFAIGKYTCQNGGAATAKYSSRVIIVSGEIFEGCKFCHLAARRKLNPLKIYSNEKLIVKNIHVYGISINIFQH